MSDDYEMTALGVRVKRPTKPLQVRISFMLDGTCRTCEALARGEMCPPHDASPRCESGKRNHCSCDICF